VGRSRVWGRSMFTDQVLADSSEGDCFEELKGRVDGLSAKSPVTSSVKRGSSSSDLCPVTPGSYTRLSTSFADQHVVRLGQSVISLLELAIQAVPSRISEG
jgi:hypothetical protein